jgi:hypothetical protein
MARFRIAREYASNGLARWSAISDFAPLKKGRATARR